MTFCCNLNTMQFSLKKNSLGFRTYDNLVQKKQLTWIEKLRWPGNGAAPNISGPMGPTTAAASASGCP